LLPGDGFYRVKKLLLKSTAAGDFTGGDYSASADPKNLTSAAALRFSLSLIII